MEIVNECDPGLISAPARSDHVALLLGNVLHVWGGLQCVNREEVLSPCDEIWLYDLRTGVWTRKVMSGELPPRLFQTCGSHLNGVLYVFGGTDSEEYTNQMYCVDLRDQNYIWRKLSARVGTPPSPRDRHSCWVYEDRLIYFGGYGWKTVQEFNKYKNFTLNDISWVMNGHAFLHFWGWNSEVHVFKPDSAAWSEPQIQGEPPQPRASHASATLGSKGYICGGLETKTVDIHCLDLVTWTWLKIESLAPPLPVGRTLHTLTPTSNNTLFLFGGLSIYGQALCDGWEFDTITRKWRERSHPYKDKPRLWHSAVQGNDCDVVIYGGSQDYVVTMDSVAVLRSPLQSHCGDVLVFQSQPYSLTRLCEDCIGKHGSVFWKQVTLLPHRIQQALYQRISYFKTIMLERSGCS